MGHCYTCLELIKYEPLEQNRKEFLVQKEKVLYSSLCKTASRKTASPMAKVQRFFSRRNMAEIEKTASDFDCQSDLGTERDDYKAQQLVQYKATQVAIYNCF